MICGGTKRSQVSYPGAGSKTLSFSTIHVCEECKLGQAQPVRTQSELDAFYKSGGYWDVTPDHPSVHLHHLKQSLVRVEKIKPYMGSKAIRVLDVGAGRGFICDALRMRLDTAFEYHFIEHDDQAVREIEGRNPGISVHRVTSDFPTEKYDLIFLNHVIEHVSDPQKFLERFKSALLPEGLLYLETPNDDYRFKGDVFPHTLFFNRSAFERLLGKTGMEPLEIRTFGNVSAVRPLSAIQRIEMKVLGRLYSIASRLSLKKIAFFLNGLIYGYSNEGDGIWVHAITRAKN